MTLFKGLGSDFGMSLMFTTAEILALLLQCLVLHDLSAIILICWFGPQETFLLLLL